MSATAFKFATCFRYYVTGSTQLLHADLHTISQTMVSRIVRDVSVALASRHTSYIFRIYGLYDYDYDV